MVLRRTPNSSLEDFQRYIDNIESYEGGPKSAKTSEDPKNRSSMVDNEEVLGDKNADGTSGDLYVGGGQ